MLLIEGFRNVLSQPVTLLLILIGDVAGLIFGAIPGLSAFTALAIMLPLTFAMEPVMGISFLMSVYVGGVSGGFISAILLGIPGTPSSIATCFDGHVLAKRGEAYRAMGVALLFSFIGGIFSAVIMSTLAPLIGQVALRFCDIARFDYGQCPCRRQHGERVIIMSAGSLVVVRWH